MTILVSKDKFYVALFYLRYKHLNSSVINIVSYFLPLSNNVWLVLILLVINE